MSVLRYDFFFRTNKNKFLRLLKNKTFSQFSPSSFSFSPAKSEIFTHCDFYYYCLIKRYLIYFTEIYWHSKKFISHFTWAAFKLTTNKSLNFRLSLCFSFLRWNFLLINLFSYLTLTVLEDFGEKKSLLANRLNKTEHWLLLLLWWKIEDERKSTRCSLKKKKMRLALSVEN